MNGLAAWLVHVIRRMPVYLDSDDHESVNNRFAYAWQQKVVAWFESRMPAIAKGITVGTTFTGDYFRELGYPESRIFLVLNGVERKRFEVLERPDVDDAIATLRSQLGLGGRDVIVYVGSISLTSHALDVLLLAHAQVIRENHDAFLLIVGSGEDIDKLKAMAVELGLQEHVRFVGRIPIEEIPLYFRLGKITVDPRHASLSAESSLSLKLVESIVAGVPCVTADIGDLRTVVDGAGLAVEPDNPSALAAGILKVLREPELHRAMKENSLKMREDFFWNSRVQSFVKVYE
jgi:glycosyltransferase involved in cell wall biosynthesis